MRNTRHNSGAAMVLFVLFFTFATSAMMFLLGQSIFADLSDLNRLTQSKTAFFVAESAVEDVVMRRVYGTYSLDTTESITLGGVTAYATTTYDSPDDVYYIVGQASRGDTIRKAEAVMEIGAGSAFNYGLQAGVGGIALSNSSAIYGNVYANGTVAGQGSATVYGDLISAGPSGVVQNIAATGSVFSNTIDNVDIDGDAHYNIDLGSTNVLGTRYTPVTNQPTTTFPISTTTIQEWKDAILNYGTTIASTDPSCSGGEYELDTSITIGYLKVECDLNIRDTGGGVVITVDGPVWVEGNITFTQGPEIRADASLGRQSVQFIADNESNRATSSQIEVRNSTEFYGTGDARSYILLLSSNESARDGGSEVGIAVTQSAIGDVLAYSNTGLVEIGNNIDLRSVTGYQLNISNGSSVTYETGLASLLFTSGPGGAYVLSDWQQVD